MRRASCAGGGSIDAALEHFTSLFIGLRTAFAAVAFVATLIIIHEFGHFFFAKVFGVGVQVFSVGFGRRLFGVVYGGTDYRLSLLPFGGYVMMEGADPFQDGGGGDGDPQSPTSFLNKPVWQRLIIVAAGPIFNLVLPVVVFTGLYMGGEPDVAAVVGEVQLASPGAAAGLQVGDRIVKVGETEVLFWTDIYDALGVGTPGQNMPFEVQRGGERLTLSVVLPQDMIISEGYGFPHQLGLQSDWANNIIGVDDPSSPAGRAGLKTNDRIAAVDGVPVGTWVALLDALEAKSGPVSLSVDRLNKTGDQESLTLTLTPDPTWTPRDVGVVDPNANPYGLGPANLFINQVVEGGAAAEAGILPGDHLVSINGRALGSWNEVVVRIGDAQQGEGDALSASAITVTLVREGAVRQLTVVPRVVEDTDALGRYRKRAMLGIATTPGTTVQPFTEARRYSFPEAVKQATRETWAVSVLVVEQVGKLLTGEAAPEKSLGGPIQIFRDAGQAAEEGLFAWARRLGLLSVSLGIVNFLPVPVLDGGQILFYLVEAVRGRPLSVAIRERAQQIGVLVLVALMFMVFIFDINRWISG
ncbi:RIP metalloprotease RseP [Myxococcota bacterium]|nr:RIP metalloprotease RseP [Myxococcota bacterium]